MRWFRRKSASTTKTIFGEYCATSSVHGVRYFSDPERTLCEKFWWIVMFLVSVGGCVKLIESTWLKWNLTPIVVNFENQPISVTEIPFPSFTICPPGKISKSMYNFAKEVKQIRKSGALANASDHFLAAVQLCQNILKLSKHYSEDLPEKRHPLSYSLVVANISVPMENFMGKCDFDERNSMILYLQYVMTDMGFCVNFNMLKDHRMLRKESLPVSDTYIFARGRPHRTGCTENGVIKDVNELLETIQVNRNITSNITLTKNSRHIRKRSVSSTVDYNEIWYPEKGYLKADTIDMVPYRGLGSGRYAACNLILTGHKKDLSSACEDSLNRGHKILLHSPVDYPQMINSVVIPFEHVTQIAVKPLVVKTSPNPKLRSYPPETRQCFFDGERYLKYFLIYTQNNCEIECLSNYTYERCQCVRFSMMRSEGMKVCDTRDLVCLHQAISEFIKIGSPSSEKYAKAVPKLNALSFRAKCNCMPSCTSYQYDFEMLKQSFTSGGKIDGVRADYLGTLSIFFKEPKFIAMVRSELYGLTDFIANCGGLLGLFTGTSLLSLIEIAYFCFVRPLSKRKQHSHRVSDVEKPTPIVDTAKECEEMHI
ncbi:hypothetical protein RP20_CCG025753 [Aedes albopictus]|nr:hypothetical protein RP20_CCG025753 [Aedes albopictus]